MQEHIGEGGEGTLPVNAVVVHKAFVLYRDKGVRQRLGYSVVIGVFGFCLLFVVRHPYAVEHAVQSLIFNIIAAAVVHVNGSGEIELKVVEVFFHCAVNHCKGVKHKGGHDNAHRNYSYKEKRQYNSYDALLAAAFFLFPAFFRGFFRPFTV